jgi:hypothetical protein
MRRILRALKWVSIVVVAAAVGLGVYVGMYWDRTWDVVERDLHASTDPDVIARGEYLARSVADCCGCHSPLSQATGALTGPEYSGATAAMEPVPFTGVNTTMWFMPPNITPLPGSAFSKVPDRDTFVARFKTGGAALSGIADAVGVVRQDDARGHRRDLRVPAHRSAGGAAGA